MMMQFSLLMMSILHALASTSIMTVTIDYDCWLIVISKHRVKYGRVLLDLITAADDDEDTNGYFVFVDDQM